MTMTERPPFGKFFLPGPTEVRPDVLDAQALPMIGHRGPQMEELIADVQPGLRAIFRTTRPVYIASASATGLMEGAIRNGARRRVLSLVNGAFSERFHEIAKACGMETKTLEVPWGRGHTPEAVDEALADGGFDAVTVVHSETSTGALNPIDAIAKVVHARGDVTLLVDSVSGMAGAPVETDAWGLDFVLTGSQKAFALPPGLAFGVANGALLARASANPHRGIYFDFLEYEKSIAKNQTPNTPALSLMYALRAQVRHIEAETIEARWARHAAMAKRTERWAAEMAGRGIAIAVLAPEGFRSPTVTCLTLPPETTGPKVTKELERRGFVIATGYGKLRDTTIRVGHMGDHTVAELDVLLGELEDILGGKGR